MEFVPKYDVPDNDSDHDTNGNTGTIIGDEEGLGEKDFAEGPQSDQSQPTTTHHTISNILPHHDSTMSGDFHYSGKLTLGVRPHCREGQWVNDIISRWDTLRNHTKSECEAAYNAAAQAINETLGSDRYAMSRLDGVNADPKSEADWTMGFREVVTRSINILRLSGHDVFDKVDKIVVLSSASELSSFANTKPEHCSGDQWTLFEYEEPFERLDDDSDDDSNGTMEFPVDKKVVDEKDFEDEAAEGEVDEEEVVDEEVGRGSRHREP